MIELLITLAGYLAIILVTALALYIVLPWLTKKSESDIDDIIIHNIKPYGVAISIVYAVSELMDATINKYFPELLPIKITDGSGQTVETGNAFTLIGDLLNAIIVLLLYLCILKIVKAVIAEVGRKKAQKSESKFDDVMVPLIDKATPFLGTIGFVLAFVYIIWGEEGFQNLLAVLGGLSFILVFLFKEPISNLFSGIYMLMDTPFKFGDLIVLENGKRYRVDNIGSRVTKLYDIEQHNVTFIPNDAIALQRLSNITLPTVEASQSLTVGVSYGSDMNKVNKILLDIANSHPHVLGHLEEKTVAIMSKTTDKGSRKTNSVDRAKLKAHLLRITCEDRVRSAAERSLNALTVLGQWLHINEKGKDIFSKTEEEIGKKKIDACNEIVIELKKMVSIWQFITVRLYLIEEACHTRQLNSDKTKQLFKELEELSKNLVVITDAKLDLDSGTTKSHDNTLPASKVSVLMVGAQNHKAEDDIKDYFYKSNILPTFSSIIEKCEVTEGVDALVLNEVVDRLQEECLGGTFVELMYKQYRKWDSNLYRVSKRLDDISQVLSGENTKIYAKGLDSYAEETVEWMREKFLTPLEARQMPDVGISDFAESAVNVTLDFYVDDIQGENFEREENVVQEIRNEIFERFAQEGVEMPFPQMDITLNKSSDEKDRA